MWILNLLWHFQWMLMKLLWYLSAMINQYGFIQSNDLPWFVWTDKLMNVQPISCHWLCHSPIIVFSLDMGAHLNWNFCIFFENVYSCALIRKKPRFWMLVVMHNLDNYHLPKVKALVWMTLKALLINESYQPYSISFK